MTIQFLEGRVDRAHQVPLFEQAFPLGPVDKAGAVATPAAPANPNLLLDERYNAWREAGGAAKQINIESASSRTAFANATVTTLRPIETKEVVNTHATPSMFETGDHSTDFLPSDNPINHDEFLDRRRYRHSLALRLEDLRSLPSSEPQLSELAVVEGIEQAQPGLPHEGKAAPSTAGAVGPGYGSPLHLDAAENRCRGRAQSMIDGASNTLTILALVALATIALLLDPKSQSAQALSLPQAPEGFADRSIVVAPSRSPGPDFDNSRASTPDGSMAAPLEDDEPKHSAPILKVLPKEALRRSDYRSGQHNSDPHIAMSSVMNERHTLSLAASTRLSQLAAPVQNAEPFRPALREPPPPATVEDGYVQDEGQPMVFDEQTAPKSDEAAVDASTPKAEGRPFSKTKASIRPAVQSSRRVAAKKVTKPVRHRPRHRKAAAPHVPHLGFADVCPSAMQHVKPTCAFWPFDIGVVLCPLFNSEPRSCTVQPISRKALYAQRKSDPYVSVNDIIMAALTGQ